MPALMTMMSSLMVPATRVAGRATHTAIFRGVSRLWLLEREKLTEDVRLRVEDYARLSMQPLLRAGYARNATVTARIIVPDCIAFQVVLTRPDKTTLTIEITRRWEATINAV